MAQIVSDALQPNLDSGRCRARGRMTQLALGCPGTDRMSEVSLPPIHRSGVEPEGPKHEAVNHADQGDLAFVPRLTARSRVSHASLPASSRARHLNLRRKVLCSQS